MRGKVEETLSDLVVLKSSAEDDMRPIVRYVSNRLEKLGMRPRYYGAKNTPAIVASFRKGGSCYRDTSTLFLADWLEIRRWSVDGRVHVRPRACDMKGGCTAMLLAAENLVAANTPSRSASRLMKR